MFTKSVEANYWQTADILSAMPWDGRRADSQKTALLEEAIANLTIEQIRANIPGEFRYRGIRFELADTSKHGKAVSILYEGFSGDVRRGVILFLLKRTGPLSRKIVLVSAQDKMDRFFREKDAAIFEEIAVNFSEYTRNH